MSHKHRFEDYKMRRIFALIIMSLVGIACLAYPSYAQSEPIILLIDGDLWSIASPDDEPFRETYWGYNNNIALSPNGQYLAYDSIPDWMVERDLAGIEAINYDQHPATNIWVMEIATRTFTRIATQAEPAEDSFPIRRTAPVWSPNSQQLAWLQIGGEGDGLHLVIYDIPSNITVTGPGNLDGVYGDAGFYGITDSLTWGDTLAFDAFSYQLDQRLITVFDENDIDAQRVNARLGYDNDLNVQEWRWIEDKGQWFIGLRYVYGWQFWDYKTDTYFESNETPQLQTISGNGLGLHYASNTQQWTVIQTDGSEIILPVGYHSPALSADGLSIVLMYLQTIDDNRVWTFEIWNDGEISPLTDMNTSAFSGASVIWTPMVWRIDGTLTALSQPTPIPTSTPNQG